MQQLQLLRGRNRIDRGRRRVALLVGGCLFMEMLDANIVTTSAPRIGAALGVSASDIGLTVTVYVVTLAALIPLSGWLSARWGTRRVFLLAIAIFALGSLGCAASDSLWLMLIMRVAQAVGGALMVPVGRLVVLSRTAKDELLAISAYLIWPALLAPVIAPLAGGLITTYANWHWLFIINLPLSAGAFAAAMRLLQPARATSTGPLDVRGFILLCGSLAGMTTAAAAAAATHPAVSFSVISLAIAAGLGVLATRHMLGSRSPLLDLQLFRLPTFACAVAGSFVFLVTAQAAPFLLPLVFEQAFHWSAVKSGSLVLLIFVGVIFAKPVTNVMYRRFGFRPMLVSCMIGLAGSMALCGFLARGTPLVFVCLILLANGVTRAMAGTGYTTIALSDVSPTELRDAGTIQSTLQHLSQGLGVASGAVAIKLCGWLGNVVGPASTSRFSGAFLGLAAIAALGTGLVLKLDRDAGHAVRGQGYRPAEPVRASTVAAHAESPG